MCGDATDMISTNLDAGFAVERVLPNRTLDVEELVLDAHAEIHRRVAARLLLLRLLLCAAGAGLRVGAAGARAGRPVGRASARDDLEQRLQVRRAARRRLQPVEPRLLLERRTPEQEYHVVVGQRDARQAV